MTFIGGHYHKICWLNSVKQDWKLLSLNYILMPWGPMSYHRLKCYHLARAASTYVQSLLYTPTMTLLACQSITLLPNAILHWHHNINWWIGQTSWACNNLDYVSWPIFPKTLTKGDTYVSVILYVWVSPVWNIWGAKSGFNSSWPGNRIW